MDKAQYIDKGTYTVLYRLYSDSSFAEIPDQIDGKPVRELADHAFSDEPSIMYSAREIRTAVLKDGRWMPETSPFLPHSPAGASLPADKAAGSGEEPPALCGRLLQEVILPEGLVSVGSYAFYGCDKLRSVTFPESLVRIGSGLFNICPGIRQLIFPTGAPADTNTAAFASGEVVFTPHPLQEILQTISHEVEVVVKAAGGSELYRLIFPEFYEEPMENTPARQIQIIWHGTGYQYRQCFLSRKLQMSKYDQILPMTAAQESPVTVVRLCLDRLKAPVGLSVENRDRYTQCLRRFLPQLLVFISEDRETDFVEWLRVLDKADFYGPDMIDRLIDFAGSKRRGDAAAYLMDLKHRRFASAVKDKYAF